MDHKNLFEERSLLPGITLRNRIVMAPMTTWAGNDDGTVADEEIAYYRRRVKEVGLVITGCTHVQANGIGFTGEFAAHDDKFIPSLKRLAAAAKSGGAPAILQIFHAGVKTLPALVSDIVAASEVEGDDGPFAPALTPRALEEFEILEVIQAFSDATRRAIEAGFDGVELHGAHGFLIQNFLSPHSNRRTDRWGGSRENRMRFPLAVVDAVQKTIKRHSDRAFALGYRISLEEGRAGGLQISDSLELIDRLIAQKIDYLHVSLYHAVEQKSISSGIDSTIVSILRDRIDGRIPLIAAGGITQADQAERALNMGATLIAIGKGLVMNPDWVQRAKNREADLISNALGADDVVPLEIPAKLWKVIETTPGWFNVI